VRLRGVFAAVIAAVLATGAPPAARGSEPYAPVRGADAPGPGGYDRTWVRVFGPRSARRVLVLVPGTYGGAGTFTLVARDIVRRVRGLQVWAWDRRTNAFEDTSVFERRDPDAAYSYYLRFEAVDGRSFRPVGGSEAPFVREWGLEVSLEDLHRVVKQARRGGRKVILGGHSLGASTAEAYASWDFRGRPGYRNIEGLVLIDGGLMSGSPPSLREVRRDLAELQQGSPFADLLGFGLPYAAGVFAETGALYARKRPRQPATLQDFDLLPSAFKPPFRVTNEALLGYALDRDTSPQRLGLIQVQSGRLALEGDPRQWVDTEVTPIQRLARVLAVEPGNFVEWYFPSRLCLDLRAADALARDSRARLLGLRTWHRRKINVPAYVFQTTSRAVGSSTTPSASRAAAASPAWRWSATTTTATWTR
jgi:pimeloyl-ACP methyl ester carboxylesterase